MKYDIKNLTLDEKLGMLCGTDAWRISTANGKLPEVFLSDGPHGLRMHDKKDPSVVRFATAMPSLSTVANSWDVELARLDGSTIADDCIDNEADVLLAPGVNIKRTPLCGRNFEYFSEDPYLAGSMGKAFIEGVQSKGIGTSLKHYCANNREYDRNSQTSEVDKRTLYEIYLRPFEIAIEAKPWTVMCSYNPINGILASENKKLLKDVLRNDLGFDGMVVSDWGAVRDSARSAKACLDLCMPHNPNALTQLRRALDEGWLTEADVDECVQNILALIEKTQNGDKKTTTTKEERHDIAVKIARECAVLLKNEDNILPLKGGKIIVGGHFHDIPLVGGGGSSTVRTAYNFRPIETEIAERLGDKAEIIPTKYSAWTMNPAIHFMKDFVEDAYSCDAVVVTVGTGYLVESEDFDRTSIRLHPSHEDLILNLAAANENVIVVLHAGSAIDMSPWIDKVKAVLLVGIAGEAGNEAAADILCGRCCPSGKLSETFPLSIYDTPTGLERGNGFYERYSEGVLVGYRWYDTMGYDVLFPFGYGLSYADFEYSDIELTKCGETDYEVSFNVTNVSDVDAKEIAQIYVKDVFTTVERPEKELVAFEKLSLAAGETKRVSAKLGFRAFAYYNTSLDAWHIDNGDFEILVGASSRDIRLKAKLRIELPYGEQYSTR